MSKALYKIEFAGSGANSGLHMAAIADFARNIEIVDGKSQEKTSFHPGEQFYFLAQHDAKLRISEVKSSFGAIQALGTVSRSHTNDIQIATAEDTQDLAYTPSAISALKWYGNSPGLTIVERAVSVRTGPLPAVGAIIHSSTWSSFRLVPAALTLKDGEEWPVLIVIYMEERA